MNLLIKTFYMICMKASILVGGQAVIEGVMMRVPGAYATALRLKNGEIISRRFDFISIIERYNMKNYFIIRGFIHLYESMKIGYKTLDWSADIYESENNKTLNKKRFYKYKTVLMHKSFVTFYLMNQKLNIFY